MIELVVNNVIINNLNNFMPNPSLIDEIEAIRIYVIKGEIEDL